MIYNNRFVFLELIFLLDNDLENQHRPLEWQRHVRALGSIEPCPWNHLTHIFDTTSATRGLKSAKKPCDGRDNRLKQFNCNNPLIRRRSISKTPHLQIASTSIKYNIICPINVSCHLTSTWYTYLDLFKECVAIRFHLAKNVAFPIVWGAPDDPWD